MRHSDSIKEIAAALAKAQGDMKAPVKDANNPFFKSKYASLDALVEAIKEPFSSNGLSYIQDLLQGDDNKVGVETMLCHSSGEWLMSEPFFVPVQKSDPQGYGSACSYIRRYQLFAMTGQAPADDDDGNAASNKSGEATAKFSAAHERAKAAAKETKPLLEMKASDIPATIGPEFGEQIDTGTGEITGKNGTVVGHDNPAPAGMLRLIRSKAKFGKIEESEILAKNELPSLEGISTALGNVILKQIAEWK